MSEPTPARRPLATFLRPAPEDGTAPAVEAHVDTPAQAGPAPEPAAAEIEHAPAAGGITAQPVPQHTGDAPPHAAAVASPSTQDAPGFLARAPSRPAPRWHWLLVAGLAALLILQSVLADRARLASDAGHRTWLVALCGVLRCSLPAWHEPTAFTMTSREIRPLPGQAGVLQVQASIRNDARWAQAWPDLRLSLSDADGRVIGSDVFSPTQYLGENPGAAVLEPGQSAHIAFRVQEPAASTVAFTFEFL
ncbi:Protein of unknown function [Stenotrophomonas maltophilia]|nr:Protein of unknown function [Stenotrophomonas maltophilia]